MKEMFNPSTEKKMIGLLGFAARARKLVSGAESVTQSIRKRSSGKHCGKKTNAVVFLASDASTNTVKRITDCTTHYRVNLVRLAASKDELSHVLGKLSDVAVCGVFDCEFADALARMIEQEGLLNPTTQTEEECEGRTALAGGMKV